MSRTVYVEAFAETEHFGLEVETDCVDCGLVFEPARKDVVIEEPVPGGATCSCCCPRCGEEVQFDMVADSWEGW